MTEIEALKREWVAWKCLTVDAHGEADETDIAVFEDRDAAQKCWPESLEAARAAAK